MGINQARKAGMRRGLQPALPVEGVCKPLYHIYVYRKIKRRPDDPEA